MDDFTKSVLIPVACVLAIGYFVLPDLEKIVPGWFFVAACAAILATNFIRAEIKERRFRRDIPKD